jgi:hypothetical protein
MLSMHLYYSIDERQVQARPQRLGNLDAQMAFPAVQIERLIRLALTRPEFVARLL